MNYFQNFYEKNITQCLRKDMVMDQMVVMLFFYSKFTLKQPPFFGRICMKQEEEGSDETQQMMLTKVTNLKWSIQPNLLSPPFDCRRLEMLPCIFYLFSICTQIAACRLINIKLASRSELRYTIIFNEYYILNLSKKNRIQLCCNSNASYEDHNMNKDMTDMLKLIRQNNLLAMSGY